MGQLSAIAAFVATLALTPIAHAASPDVATFYTGKSITLTVPGGPGGGYDAYARTLAQFFPKYIPGHPSVVLQYLSGGGGMIAANQIYNVANKDGTAIALLQSSTFLVGILGDHNAKFDDLKFTFVGNMNQEVDTCSVWHSTGIKDAEGFLHGGVILGSTGPGSNGQTFPMAMIDALGANFKLIPGYSEGTARVLAMERGEVQATCGTFVSTLHSQLAKWVDDGELRVVLQMGLARHPSLKDVPNALELAQDDETRQELRVLFSQLFLGRPIVAPPGVPADRAAVLSKAFEETMNDSQFLEMAARTKLEMRWYGEAQMKKAMTDMTTISAPVKIRLARVLGVK
jgi:tripartite-type tricarboxylate transporter receptor subunit TctC